MYRAAHVSEQLALVDELAYGPLVDKLDEFDGFGGQPVLDNLPCS